MCAHGQHAHVHLANHRTPITLPSVHARVLCHLCAHASEPTGRSTCGDGRMTCALFMPTREANGADVCMHVQASQWDTAHLATGA